jgi:hypothetical protein
MNLFQKIQKMLDVRIMLTVRYKWSVLNPYVNTLRLLILIHSLFERDFIMVELKLITFAFPVMFRWMISETNRHLFIHGNEICVLMRLELIWCEHGIFTSCTWIYSYIFGIINCLQINQGGPKLLQTSKLHLYCDPRSLGVLCSIASVRACIILQQQWDVAPSCSVRVSKYFSASMR